MGNASFKLTLMVSVCCIGFRSIDVDGDELYDCAWNVGLYSFISVCMFMVSKAFLTSSSTVIVRAG